MCLQVYLLYTCGCAQKGEFRQCDAKFDAGSMLQCDKADREDKHLRGYCSKHLIKESKASESVKNMRRESN
ncbi:hypothetical protein B0J15DRAFT_499129 [Fusarium solani]|jgi:hypothetical protein|uniref:Uncharacterized protein n=1 Tax=Fusarium solani TaxID=169388 RepID=A0A9P9K3N1_FUSSL|nr:uncharacterized protein B0J15DRAFT_499129 [Fusarium solani]KAH7247992.1 hypothetical protein B0J15DRAFT_499129 [Fusarium solani]